MTAYKRFIAYVYEYRKEKKSAGCGFLKIEDRGGQCSIEVHLRCPGLPSHTTCSVYGFVRKDGLINGILLGICMTEGDILECTIQTDSHNMGDSGIPLEKIGGIIFLTDTGVFWGTEWDDQPIRPANFRELPVHQETAAPDRSETTENPEYRPEMDTDSVSDFSPGSDFDLTSNSDPGSDLGSGSNSDSDPDLGSDSNSDSDPDFGSDSDFSSISDSDSGSDLGSGSDSKNSLSENISENKRSFIPNSNDFRSSSNNSLSPNRSDRTTNFSDNTIANEEQPFSGESPDTDNTAANIPQTPNTPPGLSANEVPKSSTWIPKSEFFFPFDDGIFEDCRKIHLCDLRKLSIRNAPLRGNRFLQYGHHNFGHLLLARRTDGQYILGVPGGYGQQEHFMANMFGFPYFKESRIINLPNVRGGYWYRLIDPPNFH